LPNRSELFAKRRRFPAIAFSGRKDHHRSRMCLPLIGKGEAKFLRRIAGFLGGRRNGRCHEKKKKKVFHTPDELLRSRDLLHFIGLSRDREINDIKPRENTCNSGQENGTISLPRTNDGKRGTDSDS
tara:strand:- start:4317 stop:4697 length:381 start_codon:yes stop_codon:yes gene_type:complete